jgi:lipopolysaccharide transport system permease protein
MSVREPLPVTVYTPDSAIANPSKLLRDMLRDLRNSRDLAWRLAVRDINAQYRQTLLGFAWALLVPLGHAAVWIFLARSGLLTVGPTALPYPAFVLAGTMLWAIFADAVHAPLGTVAASRDMLVRINFPREALILSGILQVGFNAAIKLAIVVLALIALGVRPDWGIIAAPAGVAVLMLAGTAVGLFLLPFGLLYSDVGRVLPFLMQALMYLTPVVYPIPAEGVARSLLTLNPITAPLEASRQWLTGGSPEFVTGLALTAAGALVLTLALWVVYRLALPIVIERMSP